jgi:hypothetical protein
VKYHQGALCRKRRSHRRDRQAQTGEGGVRRKYCLASIQAREEDWEEVRDVRCTIADRGTTWEKTTRCLHVFTRGPTSVKSGMTIPLSYLYGIQNPPHTPCNTKRHIQKRYAKIQRARIQISPNQKVIASSFSALPSHTSAGVNSCVLNQGYYPPLTWPFLSPPI